MIVFDQLRRNDPHLRAVTLGTLLGMGILFCGLWWVQVVSHRHYSESQKNQSFRTVRIPAVRGKILDRQQPAVALAENQPSFNVILYLDELREQFRKEWARTQPRRQVPDESWWESLLGKVGIKSSKPQRMKSVPVRMNTSTRRALEAEARYRVASNAVHQVSAAIGQPVPFGFDNFMRHYTNQLPLPVPILSNLGPNQVARLLEGGRSPRGIDLEVQPLRYYPGGTLASHVLGYLMPDNSSMEGEVSDFSFRLPDYRGHTGIERQYDADLRGKAGEKHVLVNSLGFRQSETIWAEAEPGRNVVLTLHADIQAVTEKALQSTMSNARGAAIVLDPNTGDILGMASAPGFDPNWYIPKISPENLRWMTDTNMKPEVCRPTYGSYAPGSIYKILTGLSALENGLDPTEQLYNPGAIKVAGRRDAIKDLAKPGDYDFKEAFIHSSNTYFISNGIRFGGMASLIRLSQRLHLGERTGVMPRQEVPGNFPKDALKPQRHWVDVDTAHICIGQGEIDVTPLQMAVMVAAVANGGKVLWPRLVDRIEPADPAVDAPAEIFPRRPPRDDLGVRARTLELTRDAMRADVEDEGGTGSKARVPGFRVCGKTGTAEVTKGGHVVGHTLWFASYAPFESPRYVVVVMVEGNGFGGTICAPAAGLIYKRIHQLEQAGRLNAGTPPRVATNP